MLLFILRANDLAVDLLRDTLSLELASLALGLDEAITRSFFHLLDYLRADVLGIDYSVELLFVSLDLSVAAKVLLIDGIRTSLSVVQDWASVNVIVTSDSDAVRTVV